MRVREIMSGDVVRCAPETVRRLVSWISETQTRGRPTRTIVLDLSAFASIVGTRAALAAGISLLLSRGLPVARRWAIGATPGAIGAATTIPAAISVIRGLRQSRQRSLDPGVACDERLIGADGYQESQLDATKVDRQ